MRPPPSFGPWHGRVDAHAWGMVWLDRQPVAPITLLVFFPLRDRDVALARCLEFGRLVDKDKAEPPRYIVCDARMMTGWLGLDDR